MTAGFLHKNLDGSSFASLTKLWKYKCGSCCVCLYTPSECRFDKQLLSCCTAASRASFSISAGSKWGIAGGKGCCWHCHVSTTRFPPTLRETGNATGSNAKQIWLVCSQPLYYANRSGWPTRHPGYSFIKREEGGPAGRRCSQKFCGALQLGEKLLKER